MAKLDSNQKIKLIEEQLGWVPKIMSNEDVYSKEQLKQTLQSIKRVMEE